MKTGEMTKKGLYTGAGAGLVSFAFAGFLPGSFIGGIIGLNIVGLLMGAPVEATLLPRIVVAVSMMLGVVLSGTVFVVGASLLGRTAGSVIDAVRESRTTGVGAMVRIK